MSLLQYRRHHQLLDHLPPPSVLPFLERVRAPEHACTVEYRRQSSVELPEFKTLLEDFNASGNGGGASVEGPSSLRGWNPLSMSKCSPVSQSSLPNDEPTVMGVGGGSGLGEDLLDAADAFQPSFDPFLQEQWSLPKLLQAEMDDDLPPSVSANSSQEAQSRRHIEYVANKLNISCGKTKH